MTCILRSAALAAVVSTGFASTGEAQQGHSNSIDTTATVLSKAQLTSVAAVIARLRVSPKDEFETSADYRKRVAALADPTTFAVAVSLADTTDFCWSKGFEYSADTGTMKISLETDGTNYTFDNALQITCSDRITGRYQASNAYGRTTMANDHDVRQAFVRVLDVQEMGFTNFNLSFPMDATDARARKANLRLAVVFRAAVPDTGGIVMTGTWLRSATLNSPERGNYRKTYINVSPAWLWVYDGATGEIVHKTRLRGKYSRFD